MCVVPYKGNFVMNFSQAISSHNMVLATLPVKNGSAVFNVNLK